jgi:hypothetical protein
MTSTITSRLTPILGTYHLSTESERVAGKGWYRQAHTAALDLSASHPVGVIKGAGIISALSPNNKWARNLKDADRLIGAYFEHGPLIASKTTVCTYGANLQKALTILKLDHPTTADVETILHGQKIKAFYRCILGDSQSVCVDGHAYSIWVGHHITTAKTPKISPKLYAQITADYTKASQLISTPHTITSPAELQAITWLTHKRLFGR